MSRRVCIVAFELTATRPKKELRGTQCSQYDPPGSKLISVGVEPHRRTHSSIFSRLSFFLSYIFSRKNAPLDFQASARHLAAFPLLLLNLGTNNSGRSLECPQRQATGFVRDLHSRAAPDV